MLPPTADWVLGARQPSRRPGRADHVEAIEAGKADLGFGNANSTADAIAGRKPFDAPARTVRHVVTFYSQYFRMVTPGTPASDPSSTRSPPATAPVCRGTTGT